MGLALGGLLNAAASLTTGFGEEKPLKDFLEKMSSFGFQIKSRYEVNFSGLPDVTFFVNSISTPSLKQNFTSINFDGRIVEIPINYEYDHDFTMQVINDGSGYIYSAITNFLIGGLGSFVSGQGYTMTIKCIGDNSAKGSVIKLNGVRFKSCGGLQFSNSDNDLSYFDLQCSAIDFSVTPGALKKIGGVAGAVGGLLGGSVGI